ncbi:MAG TPA: DsrE family protein [Flavisolibacter sp.]|nr:DsrE family protein [Flavisolibacter sp.]
MKRNTLMLFCFLVVSFVAIAQKDYRVVFDFTSKDTTDQRAVIRWIDGISKSNPDAQLEVVMYGQGLDLVTQGKSYVSSDVVRLAANKNISFRVCEVAMKSHNIDRNQLLAGVGTVPDGIYEVISKQREGWGYIKVKN